MSEEWFWFLTGVTSGKNLSGEENHRVVTVPETWADRRAYMDMAFCFIFN